MHLIDLLTLINRAAIDDPDRPIRLGFRHLTLWQNKLLLRPWTDATLSEMLGVLQYALGSIVEGQIIGTHIRCYLNSERWTLDDMLTEIFDAPYDPKILHNILRGRPIYGHLEN